jgi:hypothetical protein
MRIIKEKLQWEDNTTYNWGKIVSKEQKYFVGNVLS